METKHTKGPWYWRVNEKAKCVELVAAHSGTQYVMTFRRWGTQCAQPYFNVGIMAATNELSEVIKGREHHDSWCKTIAHPDAKLIAAAPELLEALQHAQSVILRYNDGTSEAVETSLRIINEAITKATTP